MPAFKPELLTVQITGSNHRVETFTQASSASESFTKSSVGKMKVDVDAVLGDGGPVTGLQSGISRREFVSFSVVRSSVSGIVTASPL